MKKFYFFLVAMMLGVITSSAASMAGRTAVINGIDGWAGWDKASLQAKGWVFTETSPGVFEITATLKGSDFLIGFFNAGGTAMDWSTKVQISGSVEADKTYPFTLADGSNIELAKQIDDCHITMDTNTNKITFSGKSVDNKFDVVYMVGDFGNGWDVNTTAYPLEKVAGQANTYEGTYTIDTTAPLQDYFFTVPKCGTKVLQLTGADVTIDATTSGKTYTLATGDKSFACAPGTYKFNVVADQEANSGKITITMMSDPVPGDNTIYWDNTEAAWEIVYAYAVNAKNEVYDGGVELSDLGNGFWSCEIPEDYTKVTFKNDAAAEYGPYEIKNDYVYGPDQSGKPYEEPVDYSTWYVNVLGGFNGWADNGVKPVDGIATHEDLAIGTKDFKVKIWNGTAEVWLSTGTAIPVDEWVKIEGNSDTNMTVAGAAEGDNYNVQFNCKTNEIYISKAGAIDYTDWYLNICGDFNEWSTSEGKEFGAEGIAENTYSDVNTSFKVVVWDGKKNTYYAKTGTLVANEWNDVNANQDDMVLPSNLQTGAVKFTFNNATKELKVEKTTSVEGIEIEENVAPVYYNLQGVRVDAPANGLYIVVRGDKVAKEIVK